jgi:hypothetical protein
VNVQVSVCAHECALCEGERVRVSLTGVRGCGERVCYRMVARLLNTAV